MRRQAVLEAVLHEVVAGRHLAAEGITPVFHRHLPRLVGERMHEDRHVQARPAHDVGDGPFVAEIRQRHQHADDLVAVLLEQVRQLLRIRDAFDAAVRAVFRPERDGLDPLAFEHAKHSLPALLAQVAGEKAAIADDHAENRLLHDHTPGFQVAVMRGRTEIKAILVIPSSLHPCKMCQSIAPVESPSSRARFAGISRTAARMPRARPSAARRCGRATPSGPRPRRRTPTPPRPRPQ